MTQRSKQQPTHALTNATPAPQGNTLPAQDQTNEPVPRTPNERDESADSQVSQEPSGQRVGRQAQQDLERGLVDTGKWPALDAAYDQVRDSANEPVKKFAP